MRREFKFPDVGEGITEGEIVRWLVTQGDPVNEDQPLIEMETDKAVVTLPSPCAGLVLSLHKKEGEIVKVGEVLVTIGDETETTGTDTPQRRESGSVVGRLEETVEEIPAPIRATPAVRALAKELGIDLTKIRGTGPGGRITREDVEREGGRVTAQAHFGPVDKIPLRGMRRSSARRVTESTHRAAAVTYLDEADVTDLEKVRIKEKRIVEEKGFKLTYLPFLIKASIAGLKVHPYLNATLDEEKEEILLKKYYNIGIAVDTPDGLMVFVIKEADQKSILDLARETATLSEKARARTIDLADLKGGTFTITNYGVIGCTYGTPIINYPEVAILGMGRIEEKPVVREGAIVPRKILPLSLTFDHRVIDGAEGARFMNTVIAHLEDPDLMLIEGK